MTSLNRTESNPNEPNGLVLLLGSGGREHALAWKLAQSQSVRHIVVAPGNPGIGAFAELRSVNPESVSEVLGLAGELNPELIVIGPEGPIAAGVSDALRNAGFRVFAPSKKAAQLEWDKEFAKEFMQRHGIPTAAFRTFTRDQLEDARSYVLASEPPIVLKATGLAAGKGVVIAERHEQALDALADMLSGAAFGEAGERVVIEEFMRGEEASIFAVCDGNDYVIFAPSQDHKRIGDNDTGPNTGGMGAYAPAPLVTDDVLRKVRVEIIEPTLRGMREEGRPYVGCLYVGIMVGHDGAPRVVEYNCRFGDPETQVVLPIWRGDLFELFVAAAQGTISDVPPAESSGAAVCVVLASEGYPGSYENGKEIGLSGSGGLPRGIEVFHAGTQLDDGQLVTAGGRVLGVTSVCDSDDLQEAIARAYEAVGRISFEGMYYRHDIGQKALTPREE